MRHTDPSRDGTLEPLDVVGLLPPFHQANPTQSDTALCDSPVLDETPTTVTTSLPTPGRPTTGQEVLPYVLHHPPPTSPPRINTSPPHPQSIFGQSDQASFTYAIYPADCDWHSLQPPPAPKMQDMDSFTEGTAVGSFDVSLRSSWSSDHFPERPPNTERPALAIIESWRTDVLLSTQSSSSSLPSSFAASSSSSLSRAAEDDGDQFVLYDPDMSNQHSLDPASWQATPTRAPKRQLSYTSVDGEHARGRKLIRHSSGMLLTRSYSQSIIIPPLDDDDNLDPSVDRSRSARSSSI